MHKDKFVFSQLIEFLDRNHFNHLVRKYEVLQILSISLTDKSNLVDILNKSKFNNAKDQYGLDGPNLFNF